MTSNSNGSRCGYIVVDLSFRESFSVMFCMLLDTTVFMWKFLNSDLVSDISFVKLEASEVHSRTVHHCIFCLSGRAISL